MGGSSSRALPTHNPSLCTYISHDPFAANKGEPLFQWSSVIGTLVDPSFSVSSVSDPSRTFYKLYKTDCT